MKAIKSIFTLLLCFVLFIPFGAQARIGEAREAIIKRLGHPTRQFAGGQTMTWILGANNDLQYLVTFDENKVSDNEWLVPAQKRITREQAVAFKNYALQFIEAQTGTMKEPLDVKEYKAGETFVYEGRKTVLSKTGVAYVFPAHKRMIVAEFGVEPSVWVASAKAVRKLGDNEKKSTKVNAGTSKVKQEQDTINF